MARSTASSNFQVVRIWHASASSCPQPCWIFLEGFQLSPKSFACVCTLVFVSAHTRARSRTPLPGLPTGLCRARAPLHLSLTPLVKCSFVHFSGIRGQQCDKGQSYLQDSPIQTAPAFFHVSAPAPGRQLSQKTGRSPPAPYFPLPSPPHPPQPPPSVPFSAQ